MIRIITATILFVLLSPLWTTAQPAMPNRWDLIRAARQAGSLQIVYGTENSEYAQRYAEFLKSFSKGRRNQAIEVRRDDELTTEELAQLNCLLVGSPASNRHIRRLATKLPLKVNGHSIEFDNKQYRRDGQVFSLSYYPNPLNQAMPIHLLSGCTDDAVYDLLLQKYDKEERYFEWTTWGYELYEHGHRVMLGNFDDEDWSINRQSHFDFSAQTDTLVRSKHFVFVEHKSDLQKTEVEKMAQECEAMYQQIMTFVGQKKTLPKIKVHLYGSAEEKGLMMANIRQAHCDHRRCELHTVINEMYPAHFNNGESELLLRQLLGKPRKMMLERGLSLRFSPKWNGEGADFWAARLVLSDNMIELADLLDEDRYQEESDLITGAMSASFVNFLLQKLGKEKFLSIYSDWSPTAPAIKRLEAEWLTYARQKAEGLKERIAQRQKRSPLPYLKGFNFAHEGYRIYNGYLSHMATKALQYLQGLNGNAVAIVPYSYMRNIDQPSFLPIMRDPGTENDESVIHSAFQARQLGMTTLLKPQVWFSGSWPGAVEMKSEEDWQKFFDYYYRWMRHYALLAEIHQIDLLCVGVEFAQATLQREADWRKLFQKLRGLYSGRLTYAANWGEEFEKSQFWDELDYIGINCYYPLSKKDQPSDKELRQNFQSVLKKVEQVQRRFNKPVLFTEIGFRSVEGPWKNPHAEADGRPYAPKDQERCYKIVFEGLADKDWCEGIFWWKWPSYLEYRGNRNSSFTPNRKPAEQVVKKWFGKIEK